MLKNVYERLNARKCIWRLKAKVLSKEYFCEMYPTCVSSLRVYFVLIAFQKSHFFPLQIAFEIPPTGGLMVRTDFRPVKVKSMICKCVTCEQESWLDHNLLRQLLRYVNAWDHLILGIEIVFFCFIFYYIIEEILEIVHTGWGVILIYAWPHIIWVIKEIFQPTGDPY